MKRSRGRRVLDGDFDGCRSLSVFTSEVPRFCGPMNPTDSSTFARENARVRSDKKRPVEVPDPGRCADPGAHNPWNDGVSHPTSAFTSQTKRDMYGTWQTVLDIKGWCNSHGRHGHQPGLDHIPGGPVSPVKQKYALNRQFMPECPRFPDDLDLLKKSLMKTRRRELLLVARKRPSKTPEFLSSSYHQVGAASRDIKSGVYSSEDESSFASLRDLGESDFPVETRRSHRGRLCGALVRPRSRSPEPDFPEEAPAGEGPAPAPAEGAPLVLPDIRSY